MKKIHDYLIDLGLTEIEAILYQGLLETGPTTIKRLSDHVNIKRITVHFNIENLISKGLITQTIVGARRQILAESPERLKYFVDRKIESNSNLLRRFPDFLRTATSLQQAIDRNKEVEIKYYEGKKGVETIYADVMRSKEVRSYANLEIIANIFPENVDLFIKGMRDNPRIRLREIVGQSEISRKNSALFAKNPRYQYKFAPASIKLTPADIMIYGNKVAIVNVAKETSGMIFNNHNYYQTSKEIFDFIWSVI